MLQFNQYLNYAALNGLYYSQLYKLFAPASQGCGLIFTLHQVNNLPIEDFSPNSILKITPEFLEESIKTVLSKGYEIISLSEMKERLVNGPTNPRFAVFTFDDGYKDNRDVALKVFEKYNVPLTIYIVSEYSSHQGQLWWFVLEEVIKTQHNIKDPFTNGLNHPTSTTKQKYEVFDKLYWKMRPMDPEQLQETIRKFAKDHAYDILALTKKLIMGWDELRALNQHPLVTLGTHTKHHHAISRLNKENAINEMRDGAKRMEAELKEVPKHFSFPYGDPTSAAFRDFNLASELGFETAVTTRKGVLFEGHKHHLTALPRVSLNGEYQKRRYLETFISGLPFLIKNNFKRLNVS